MKESNFNQRLLYTNRFLFIYSKPLSMISMPYFNKELFHIMQPNIYWKAFNYYLKAFPLIEGCIIINGMLYI